MHADCGPQAKTLDHRPPMTLAEYNLCVCPKDLGVILADFPVRTVSSVRMAIAANIQPRMNKMGSSGSYFARDVNGNIVGIFKPKVTLRWTFFLLLAVDNGHQGRRAVRKPQSKIHQMVPPKLSCSDHWIRAGVVS
jgi:hypothetical protein